HVQWPSGDYKKEIHDEFQEMQGFPLVIGAIDGSHIPLFQAPDRINKDVYFSRKHKYGIHLQGIVDHKGHFIHYDIGWPASEHDAKVFQNSSIYNQQNTFFEGEEYFLADSAYPLLLFIMTPFKRTTKGIEIIDTVLILHNFIEKHGDTWGQSDYIDNQIEIQPEEDKELID
ncbi:17244_t:CDS:2, partial [Gigaspora rosea]